jgi:hypothetical protein
MTNIPDDMYQHVFALATGLVHASEAGDTKDIWRLYEELRRYCESESASGREHPFLWETLADFTLDDQVATALYLRALESARERQAPGFEATILLGLAGRHRAMGENALANGYALQASEIAQALDEPTLQEDIAEFFLGTLGQK